MTGPATAEAPLRIAHVASEVTPFSKSGGLADVVSALAVFQARRGHDVRVFTPLYGSIQDKGWPLVPVSFLQDLPVELGPWRTTFSVATTSIPGAEAPVYFVHFPSFYAGRGLYTNDDDEPLRFAFLCLAAVAAWQHMGWSPQIAHSHDWHTGLLPLYLQTRFGWDQLFHSTRTVLTLHNLSFQGTFRADVADAIGLGPFRPLLHQEDLQRGVVNFLKTGLLYAHQLTTVSRTYAREIQTPDQGFGLDAILRYRDRALTGIVNGVDYGEWSPEADAHLPATYSADDLAGKRKNKADLLSVMKLDGDLDRPLLGIVSRLTAQKGFDLCFETLPAALAHRGARLVVLGSGEPRYADFFRWLQAAFPGRAVFYDGYSEELAHRIEAGADAFLMPSRFEPCGLNQMYSLRYGTVPVVRKTGGLADTVQPFDPEAGTGTGFVFEHFTTEGLAWALAFALDTWYEAPQAWRGLMLRGMAQDFSWDRQGLLYEEVYGRALRS